MELEQPLDSPVEPYESSARPGLVRRGCNSPLDLSEIREVIFKFLGKKDLLRCRLVSKDWNVDSTAAFQKDRHTIKLNERTLANYMKFISSLTDYSTCFLYEVSVKVGEKCSEVEEDTFNSVLELAQRFGAYCVSKLEFKICYRTQMVHWEEIFRAIKMLGNGLESLKIQEDGRVGEIIRPRLPIMPPHLYNISQSPWKAIFNVISTFAPNLHELHLFENRNALIPANISFDRFPSLTSFSGKFMDKTYLLVKVVKSSPHLKHLALLGATHIDIHYRHNQYVVDFLKECFHSSISLEHIESFDVGLGELLTYKALKKFHFSRLKILTVHVLNVIDMECASIFKKFLLNNCPELQRLEFDFGIGFSNNELFSCIPELPHLRNFGYLVKNKAPGALPEDLLINKFNGIAEKLPNLESVSTSLGLCFYSYALLQKCDEQGVKKVAINESDLNPFVTHVRDWSCEFVTIDSFTGVKELNLIMTEVEFDKAGWCPSLKQNMSQLHKLFPNLKKLVINNQVHPSQGNIYQKIVLREILETFSSLEELEFINYNEDWLSQVIYESSDAVRNLQGLRKIRIPDIEPWCASPKCRVLASASMRPFVCLTTFLKYLPSLELVQVASPSTSTPWAEHVLELGAANVQIQYL